MKNTPMEEIDAKAKELRNLAMAHINRLTLMVRSLERSEPSDPKDLNKSSPAPRKRRSKAPLGSLGEAIMKVLSLTTPMNNKAIRVDLYGARYPYPISSETIRRECVKLKDEGKIVSEGEGRGTKYLLKKPD